MSVNRIHGFLIGSVRDGVEVLWAWSSPVPFLGALRVLCGEILTSGAD